MGDSPDDVVITGIAGRFPEADNMVELREHLINGVDMTSEDDRRWDPGKRLYDTSSHAIVIQIDTLSHGRRGAVAVGVYHTFDAAITNGTAKTPDDANDQVR